MRIKYEYKEKTLSIFSQDHSPDIAVIDGIVLEHIHEKKGDYYDIRTEIGGRGGRLSFYLKKYKLTPTAFSFLAEDEFLNFILSTYDSNNIPLTWSPSGKKNNRKIRIIDEKKEYYTNYHEFLDLNPLYIEEYICNVDNIFFSYEKWAENLIDVLYSKGKNTYVDVDTSCLSGKEQFTCNYLFISNFDNLDLKLTNSLISDHKIIFMKDKIFLDDVEYSLYNQGNYYEEAISAYQTVFLYYILTKRTIQKSHEFALETFNKVLKEGKL
ncbi:MAG: hypothetical protein ACQESN_11600 [Thermotogota bacterium]